MNVGQVVRVRSDVPDAEREHVGIPLNIVLGEKCVIDRIVPKTDNDPLFITTGVRCNALEVTMLEGNDEGGCWWIPAKWIMPVCMFESAP